MGIILTQKWRLSEMLHRLSDFKKRKWIFFCNFAVAFGKASHRSPLSGLKAQPTSALPTANSLRLGLRWGPQ